MKKILLVDDSALMRRALCDILTADGKYEVTGQAKDGKQALEMILTNLYDVVILDVHMPRMNGMELLRELQKQSIQMKIILVSAATKEGTGITTEALELGVADFITKPGSFLLVEREEFATNLLRVVDTVASRKNIVRKSSSRDACKVPSSHRERVRTVAHSEGDRRGHISSTARPTVKYDPSDRCEWIVAIASSTGGPKALQDMMKMIPEKINAPIVIVQHMPMGFTKSFSQRLDSLCRFSVEEAREGEAIIKGNAYLGMGGMHLNIVMKNGVHTIHYSDQPMRVGVKPCANYMYESLVQSRYKKILCVVLTGMGSDGTEGIVELNKHKSIEVIAQDKGTCVVYGMPQSITKTGLVKQNYPIDEIANQIIKNVGVR
ncbi:MAG: chemotaxis-specific protein-glutamate methyltransferase CheB [Eubacteriales bacterium]